MIVSTTVNSKIWS